MMMTDSIGNDAVADANNDDEEDLSTFPVDEWIQKDVLHPNPSVRHYLAYQWRTHATENQQLLLRSRRAHAGIKCSYCGNIGYFIENCPSGCINRPKTPDSDDTPPSTPKRRGGVGLLWNVPTAVHSAGNANAANSHQQPRPAKAKTNRINLASLKHGTLNEARRLENSDKPLQSFDFFHFASKGYNRTLPELTLHQVMRKLMRILKENIKRNVLKLEAVVDGSLLLPPTNSRDEPDYPQKLKRYKQYRPYFVGKLAASERKQKQYQYQGAFRPVDTLDCYFRVERPGQLGLYSVDPKAGSSMHSKVGWKSILATGDHLAISDPSMAEKIRGVEAVCGKQGEWVDLQKASMMKQNDHFEHCAFILRQEMEAEHERESKMLVARKSMSKKEMAAVWKERLSSADRLMNTITLYGFANGFDEADYLVYNLKLWKELSLERVEEGDAKVGGNHIKPATGNALLTDDGSSVASGSASISLLSLSTNATEVSTVMSTVANPYSIEEMRLNQRLRGRGRNRRPQPVVINANDESKDKMNNGEKENNKKQKQKNSGGFGIMLSQAMLHSDTHPGAEEHDLDVRDTRTEKQKLADIRKSKELKLKKKRALLKRDDRSTDSERSDSDYSGDDKSDANSKDDDDNIDGGDVDDESTSVALSIARAKREAEELKKQQEAEKLRRSLGMSGKKKAKNFVVVRKPHQSEIDNIAIAEAKEKFR
jgi:hypothetical protein